MDDQVRDADGAVAGQLDVVIFPSGNGQDSPDVMAEIALDRDPIEQPPGAAAPSPSQDKICWAKVHTS